MIENQSSDENCKMLVIFFDKLRKKSHNILAIFLAGGGFLGRRGAVFHSGFQMCEFSGRFFPRYFSIWDSKGAKECKSDRFRQKLSNEYLVEKFGFDTEENEACKVR